VRASFPNATILQKPFFVPELVGAIDRVREQISATQPA